MHSPYLVNLILLFVCSVPIFAQQTVDDVEKNIAKLPPDQRTYERFRYWVNLLPPMNNGIRTSTRVIAST